MIAPVAGPLVGTRLHSAVGPVGAAAVTTVALPCLIALLFPDMLLKVGNALLRAAQRVREMGKSTELALHRLKSSQLDYDENTSSAAGSIGTSCASSAPTHTTQEDTKETLQKFYHQQKLQAGLAASARQNQDNNVVSDRRRHLVMKEHRTGHDSRWQTMCKNVGNKSQ